MSQFDSLVAELTGKVETMAKALPVVEPEPDADDAVVPPADGEPVVDPKKKVDEPMGKSITVMVDGVETEVADAGPLLKAITDRLDANDTVLGKALTGFFGLVESQGTLLKALADKVEKIGSEGKGRRAVVTLHERKDSETPLAKSDSISPEAFMGKAMDCFTAGKFTGTDIATIENLLHKRQPIPQEYINVVAGHSA